MMKELFYTEVSMFENIDAKEKPFAISIDDIVERIKKGNIPLKEKSSRLRDEATSDKEREEIKKSLPLFMFNGIFKTQDEDSLQEHSELCFLSFNGFPDHKTMMEHKQAIISKPYIYACFTSLSGEGLKALARVPKCNKAEHKRAFDAIAKDLNSQYFNNAAGSLSAKCFESYDPNIYFNQLCDSFTDFESEVKTEPKKEDNDQTVNKFIQDWKAEFIERIKKQSKSKKQVFHYGDALSRSVNTRTELDKVMVEYLGFINSDPLKENDYFKYVNAYKEGVKLKEKYFRHDLNKLQEYYKKSDENKEYNPFSKHKYERYVLYMMLKFSGLYLDEYDGMFNVKKDESREYNPITLIPSVLRQYLPFKIKEYDIAQAYPTFLFLNLNIKPFDVYSQIDKRLFNTLLNMHHEVKNATIEAVRSKLKPIYKERVDEVITDERFYNKGQMFRDLAKYEAEYIQKFVKANDLKYYVRLHDGVVALADAECKKLEFGIVKFKVKEFSQPDQLSNIVNFYSFDEDKLLTSPVRYSRFLEQENFIRITREGHDQLTILKNDNRIVTPINHKTDLVPFLKKNINEVYPEPVEDRIARDATNVIQQGLQLLTPIPLEYHRDTKQRCDIPFKNGIARITADGMELINYDEVEGFFPKHSTQQHEISFVDVDEKPSSFRDFLILACTGGRNVMFSDEGEKTIMAFISMFGYLITNYKDPAFSPAIILSDEGADGENRNGGRGKSLIQKALSYFRPSIEKGGNAYDPNYTHVHADLKMEHDLYLLDDVPSNFNYNALYTHITGSIDAQRKGVTAETIPFEYAPKFVISTNWAVRYDEKAVSTNRRFIEYKFSDFWNIENTPVKYFGKSFFSDWEAEEWNAFYNFGFFCVQHYLRNGLQKIEYDKKEDNFRAYFYNDAILEEAERIFDLLDGQDFTVTDFVDRHRQMEMYKYKPEFNIRNARKYIDSYIEYKGLDYRFEKMTRKWRVIRNMCNSITDDITDKKDVTF